MSRPAVAALCAAVLLAGLVAGRVTGSRGGTVTLERTVERSVVVLARHVGAARDARDTGPLDLARVATHRQGGLLRTTIVARGAWRDSLLRRVRLAILYDTNDDGAPDRRDVVFLFHGQPTSWVSSLGQGVRTADVTRPNARTIVVARDLTVFYDASGEAQLAFDGAIGVAVVARWPGGGDRVPDHGWITAPPPKG